MGKTRERTLNPTKAGEIYGYFKPSVLGVLEVPTSDGGIKRLRMNRRDRRAYVKGDRNGKESN